MTQIFIRAGGLYLKWNFFSNEFGTSRKIQDECLFEGARKDELVAAMKKQVKHLRPIEVIEHRVVESVA